MAIAVAGTSIDETPDDTAGWVVATQRGKTSSSAETPLQVSAPTPGKRAAPPTQAQIIRRVNANFAKTARMPFVLRGEYKIVRERSNSRSESRRRARSRERSVSRNRQCSVSCNRTWTDVVKGGAKSKKDAKTSPMLAHASEQTAEQPANSQDVAAREHYQADARIHEGAARDHKTISGSDHETHLATAQVGHAVECKRSINSDARPIEPDGHAAATTAGARDR
ncbi:hypothetical protein MRX96_059077 [Rhipicephalus microplus]